MLWVSFLRWLSGVFFLSLISLPAISQSYWAKYGDFNTDLYASADAACLALGSMIYPDHYARQITGATGIPDAGHDSTCSTDVSWSTPGQLYFSTEECDTWNPDTFQCDAPIETCEDGLPVNAGADLGYVDCDRPPLKSCPNGDIILAVSICPLDCFDYQTCLDFARENYSCGSAETEAFTYFSPSDYEYSCTSIADTSPDHPDNDGNADGNEANDPNSDPVTPVADLDPESLATAIDNKLQDDFSNVERAIRENGIKSEEFSNRVSQDLSGIQSEISGVRNSVDQVNSTLTGGLSEISEKLSNSNGTGECDPESSTYLDCISSGSLPEHTATEHGDLESAVAGYYGRLEQIPLVQMFSSLGEAFSGIPDNPSCPAPTFEIFDTHFTMDFHCSLYEQVAGLLSTLFMIFWTIVGIRHFASA
ncbi:MULTISPECIES: hypothetical protein [unclassified Microbulbifer]|uniref:hypothetical protein n=1 Tax=unclassified Microbulbifer TaxID=2619833 RepID=UPI0027E3B9C2|nr:MULTISPECIES: hypothetical protein [unclassified Microbulbifer]